MKKINKLLSLGLLTVGALACGKTNYEILNKNSGFREEYVERGDTYWDFAEELRDRYPELKKIDKRDIYQRISELNDNKMLKYGETVLIPEYDFN